MAIKVKLHIQKAFLTLIGLKLRDKSMPIEKGKSILSDPSGKVQTVQCPAHSYVSVCRRH